MNMNRIIKFRGKECPTGEWAYGHYTTANTRDPETGDKTTKHIIHAYDGLHEVEGKTVGQFSSLRDKEGKDIYEGDIIKVVDDYPLIEVRFVRGVFAFLWNGISMMNFLVKRRLRSGQRLSEIFMIIQNY